MLVLITEFIFQEINIFLSYGDLILAIVFIFIIQLVNALEESIQKYLYEYNQLNPFFFLMYEGIFGFIITIFYCLIYNPFDIIITFYNNSSKSEFGWLIFCFILYIILSGGKNTFRVVTTTILSPMTTNFMDYIINPPYIILYFYFEDDFKSKGKINYAYLSINFVISLIITFCGGVYNEGIILFFCGLEHNTHNQIINRATENAMTILIDEYDEESVT